MDKGTGSVRARYNGFVIDKDDLMNTAGGPNCLKIDITMNLANLDVAKVQSLDLLTKFLHKEAPEALDITISFYERRAEERADVFKEVREALDITISFYER